MKKLSFLFIFNHAPHASLDAKEGMDFAFSCAAFEQKTDVLFRGNGIYQLLKQQDTSALNIKNHSQGIAAFGLYGIEHCYYETASLDALQLDASYLLEQAEALQGDLHELLQHYDYVLNY